LLGCFCDYLCLTGHLRPKTEPCSVYIHSVENRYVIKHHKIMDREVELRRRKKQESEEERRKRKTAQKKAYRQTEEGHKRHLEAMARYRAKNREKLRIQAQERRRKGII